MASRADVYSTLDSERDYQDSKFKNIVYPHTGERRTATDRSLDEFILYIQQYAQEAGALTTHEKEEEALHFVRKVGALCVGCMERHGAPRRYGF